MRIERFLQPAEATVQYTASEYELASYLHQLARLQRENSSWASHGFTYYGMEDWLLERGQFWALPETGGTLPLKLCFVNAYAVARKSARSPRPLRYVEGYALNILPVHHAWCVDEAGTVVETTWHEPGLAYYGAVFTVAAVRARRLHSQWLAMLEDWDHDHPLFRMPRLGPS
jgi:hypothetical protein